jgi:hypothetical protein
VSPARAHVGEAIHDTVVTLSFGELLARLFESADRFYWLDSAVVGYGDAERFTRRE